MALEPSSAQASQMFGKKSLKEGVWGGASANREHCTRWVWAMSRGRRRPDCRNLAGRGLSWVPAPGPPPPLPLSLPAQEGGG